MDSAMCLRSKSTTDESSCIRGLLDSGDSKCVCARGNESSLISPWKETLVEKKENKQRGEGKSSKNASTPRRSYDRKEKPVEFAFHHYQDYTMYALQYRKEHTQGSSENEEKFLLGYNVPDPYLPTTLNASVLEERMRLIEAISEYYHKQSNLHRACVNLTATERKSAKQEKTSELPQISSAKKCLPNSTPSSNSNPENSLTPEVIANKKSTLDSPRFNWMESIAKGQFHEVASSYYRNPKPSYELDTIANSRRYLLTQPSGLNDGNLYVGNTLLPFNKPNSSNVSKCEVFSSSEIPRTPRIDKKTKSGNSIIAVIGHSTGDFKADSGNKSKKKDKKGDQYGYYKRFETSKTNCGGFSPGKVHSQGNNKRSSLTYSDSSVLGSAGVWADR